MAYVSSHMAPASAGYGLLGCCDGDANPVSYHAVHDSVGAKSAGKAYGIGIEASSTDGFAASASLCRCSRPACNTLREPMCPMGVAGWHQPSAGCVSHVSGETGPLKVVDVVVELVPVDVVYLSSPNGGLPKERQRDKAVHFTQAFAPPPRRRGRFIEGDGAVPLDYLLGKQLAGFIGADHPARRNRVATLVPRNGFPSCSHGLNYIMERFARS